MKNRYENEMITSPWHLQNARNATSISSLKGNRRQTFNRRFWCTLAVALLLLIPTSPTLGAEKPEHEIKLATLAPENSTLMQVFNEMNAELLKETGGKVGFKLYSGFVLGDEEDVLRKLRIGMVHAATFTMAALTDINPDLRALQTPFLFNNYDEVDYVLVKLDADLKRGFEKQGMEVLGWPEVGFLYFFSKAPVAGPEDLKDKKIWGKANAPMFQALVNRAGVSSVSVNVPDVLVALQTNLLEVVFNSPYYALVTQWYTQVSHFTDLPISYMGGALIMDKKTFQKIPAPLQETLKKVAAKHTRRLTERTRKDNAEAMEAILKRGVRRVTPNEAQVRGFEEISDQAMGDLMPKYLQKESVDSVRAALKEARASSRKP